MQVVRVDGSTASVRALTRAVADALDGGEAVLPLGEAEQQRITAALRPEEPVDPRAAAVIATSGSTGAPKGVLLSASALTASAVATHARLGGPGRWLLATPPQYVGGLQVLVRSLVGGTEPGVLDLAGGFDPDGFAAAAAPVLRASGPHYTALVPTQLVRLLDAGGGALDAAKAFDAILVGGAATPPALRRRAEDLGVGIVRAYGMSETAGGCVYDGVPLDGVRIRIGKDDRIQIAGDVLALGYRDADRPLLTEGWFITDDLGRIGDDGALTVLGRADNVINTGGVKVAAGAVERALREHPGVQDACVVGLPDPEWGEIVVAAVVADAAESPSSQDLATHVRTREGAPAAPKYIRTVDVLPLIGPGKVDRAAVRAMMAENRAGQRI